MILISKQTGQPWESFDMSKQQCTVVYEPGLTEFLVLGTNKCHIGTQNIDVSLFWGYNNSSGANL